MTNGSSEKVKRAGSDGRIRWTRCAVLGVVFALVIGVYAWSASSGTMELLGSKAENTYYNLLVQSFSAGQLNLKTPVPPGLTQLADPYDPMASAPYRWNYGYPLHDLSYYKGRLYLYFGITPALMLFWPCRALTGHWLLHKDFGRLPGRRWSLVVPLEALLCGRQLLDNRLLRHCVGLGEFHTGNFAAL
jgi:hypothetical protein